MNIEDPRDFSELSRPQLDKVLALIKSINIWGGQAPMPAPLQEYVRLLDLPPLKRCQFLSASESPISAEAESRCGAILLDGACPYGHPQPTRSPYDSGECCMKAHQTAIPPWTCKCPCHSRKHEDPVPEYIGVFNDEDKMIGLFLEEQPAFTFIQGICDEQMRMVGFVRTYRTETLTPDRVRELWQV